MAYDSAQSRRNRLSVGERIIRVGARIITPTYTAGAVVLLTSPRGIALVRSRVRQRARWGCPGGFARVGEDFADTARREVQEETGIVCDTVEFIDCYCQPWARHIDNAFHAEVSGETPEFRAGAEIVELQWFSPSDLPELTRETSYLLERPSAARKLAKLSR